MQMHDEIEVTELLSDEEMGSGAELVRLVVSEAYRGVRLDVYLAGEMAISRSAAAGHADAGRVSRRGKVLTKKDKVAPSDEIEILLPPPTVTEALPEQIPLDVRYEDDDIIVVNKPTGMVVHPAPGNPNGTLVNALLYHCGSSLSGIGGEIRPGIVHRIDKDTSGLLVVAKNDMAHRSLSEQLKVHAVSRIYTAIAVGRFREASGTVDAPIGRHPTDRKRMAVIRDPEKRARDAVTHYTCLGEYVSGGEHFTAVRCQLETGRTHQIRVHMAHLGHPLLGDPVYGGNRTRFEGAHPRYVLGQMLHAGELTLTHPRTGEKMTFHAPLPDYFEKVLSLLGEA